MRLCCFRMAWRSTGRTNSELVNNLRGHNIITSDRVKEVMMAVDRNFFVDRNPYEDRPQSIGYGATISAPHMHAYSLSILEPNLKPGARVLDVGAGSGFLTACFALMVGTNGVVVGVEHVDELHHTSVNNMQNWLESKPNFDGSTVDFELGQQIKMVVGDGRQGWSSLAPYNAIHVGAATPVIPENLVNQLSPGGRLLCPLGPDGGDQNLVQVDKDLNGRVTSKELMGVRYIPLTDLHKQTQEFN